MSLLISMYVLPLLQLPPPQPGAPDQDAARLLYHFYTVAANDNLCSLALAWE